ncbi:LOW QUALITY PROTEIN: sodium-dependent glucose transporter 1A-like [Dermacentor silvarum]|uniref:LOW QUALITY PROTEIN: sodium-dependent glucose transporter 1A-like n=1 Tax=Dermacentor silvarum TaxID=543639 RepID=UPI0021017D32|nr:LOW QUALITY PROTEIN: sodium-dependent glucose transporter 1A-like [Dermacentor silvarum]
MIKSAERKSFKEVRYHKLRNGSDTRNCSAPEKTFSPRVRLWLNLGRTCNVSLGNLGMGLITALAGVALLDLGEIYGADISTISHLITTRSVGGLLGSLLGGKLYDTYNTQLTSIIMLLLTSITVLMVPLCGALLVAHVMVFFMGLSLGAFGTGANVWIINMWPEDSSPALHIFHFAFAVGSLMAPLIAKPFLSLGAAGNSNFLREASDLSYSFEPTSNETGNQSSAVKTLFDEETVDGSGQSTVYYAFAIVSAFYLFLVISMTLLYCTDNSDFRRRPARGQNGNEVKDVRYSRISLALLSVFECVYVALECTTSQMLTTFAVKSDLHFSKPDASRVVAVYFFFFAASRLVAAIVAMKVSSLVTLIFTHGILVATAAAMDGVCSSNALVLWVGSAITGFGQGPVKAAVVAWTAEYINISNKMMSVVVVTGSIGNLAPALLVGQFIDRNPDSFLYVSLGAVLLSVVILLFMYAYMSRRRLLKSHADVQITAGAEKPGDVPLL